MSEQLVPRWRSDNLFPVCVSISPFVLRLRCGRGGRLGRIVRRILRRGVG